MWLFHRYGVELFSEVILNTYKNGILIIITNRGGMPEIVTDTKTELIIVHKDDDLANGIDRMCDTDIIRNMCNNILDVFQDLLYRIKWNEPWSYIKR